MNKKIGFLLALMCIVNQLYAQDDVNTNVVQNNKGNTGVSPEIFNTDLYTGTSTVNVPIYDYKIDGLDLGISASYNTQGVKVDQIASSIGLGWSLNAGAGITRQAFGIEDEVILPATATDPELRGYFVQYDQTDPNVQSEGHNQKDRFTLMLNGRAIDFQYSIGTGAIIAPICGIKIDMLLNGIPISNTGLSSQAIGAGNTDRFKRELTFVVTDEQNNKYYFDKGEVEYANFQPDLTKPARPYKATQSWVVTQIITYTGAIIKYTYDSRTLDYSIAKIQQVSESQANCKYSGDPTVIQDKTVTWTGDVAHVKRIEYPNGTTVNFNFETNGFYDRQDFPSAFKVNSISVESGYDQTFRNKVSYRFNCSYFCSSCENGAGNMPYINYQDARTYITTNTVPNTSDLPLHSRLKLNSIDKIGSDDATIQRYYTFDYDQSYRIPPRLSPGKDFYGFYNGAVPVMPVPNNRPGLNNLSILLHTTTIDGTTYTYGVDKADHVQYAKTWVLNKVTNAQGGITEFEFKSHSLSNPANGYTYIGSPTDPENIPDNDQANDGLCIAKITHKDGYNADNTTYTTYDFSDGERFTRAFTWYVGSMGTLGNGVGIQGKMYFNSFVCPYMTMNGANHGYRTVSVSDYGYNGVLLGRKEYSFTGLAGTTLACGTIGEKWHTYGITVMKEFLGKLASLNTFDINNTLVSRITNSFEFIPTYNPLYVDQNYSYFSCNSNGQISNIPQNTFTYFFYFLNQNRVNKKTTESYENGKTSTSIEEYQYDDKQNVYCISTHDSRGFLYKKYMTFMYNFPNFPWSSWPSDQQQHSVSTETWKYNSTTDSALIGYQSTFPVLSGPYLRFPAASKTMMSAPLSSAAAGAPNFPARIPGFNLAYNTDPNPGPIPALISSNNLYDDRNNVLEQTDAIHNSTSSAIWDTRIGQKIATAANAPYNDIAYTSFEGAGYAAYGSPDYNKGNWDFNPAQIQYAAPGAGLQPMTGRYYYRLDNGLIIRTRNNLASGKKYILTCWATAPPYVTITIPNQTLGNGTNVPAKMEMQAGSWNLYSYEFTGTGNSVCVTSGSGSTMNVDELRLYPADAAMATTTFEPLFGPNSACDERGNIHYFEYDVLGRQTMVRDINRNVLSVSKQVVQGADN